MHAHPPVLRPPVHPVPDDWHRVRFFSGRTALYLDKAGTAHKVDTRDPQPDDDAAVTT